MVWMNLHGLDAEGKIRKIGFLNCPQPEGAVEAARGFLGDPRINRVEILAEPHRPFNILNGPRFPGALICEVER